MDNINFYKGNSGNLPESGSPGNVYICKDTGEMIIQDTSTLRFSIKDPTKLPFYEVECDPPRDPDGDFPDNVSVFRLSDCKQEGLYKITTHDRASMYANNYGLIFLEGDVNDAWSNFL